jgi:hypothetical protein
VIAKVHGSNRQREACRQPIVDRQAVASEDNTTTRVEIQATSGNEKRLEQQAKIQTTSGRFEQQNLGRDLGS